MKLQYNSRCWRMHMLSLKSPFRQFFSLELFMAGWASSTASCSIAAKNILSSRSSNFSFKDALYIYRWSDSLEAVPIVTFCCLYWQKPWKGPYESAWDTQGQIHGELCAYSYFPSGTRCFKVNWISLFLMSIGPCACFEICARLIKCWVALAQGHPCPSDPVQLY